MCPENLWGDFSDLKKLKTPKAILREQAALLTNLTKGLLQGGVRETQKGEVFLVNLYVVVQSLNNYTYNVLQVYHELKFYPLSIDDYTRGKSWQCSDENDFIRTIIAILSSPELRNVIQGLISQAES